MTAQPIHHAPPPPWQPNPVRQRLANHTIEDVLNLPPDAPRVELLDGVMLVVPSPTLNHQNVCSRLWMWLQSHTPPQYQAVQAVGVAVSVNRTYEPDVLLHSAEAEVGRHYLVPTDVVLVVEVVSPGTRARDRFAKPAEYAAAGIEHYWRIEQDPMHVYAYRRTTAGTYELVADSAELIELDAPFPIKLPITEITP